MLWSTWLAEIPSPERGGVSQAGLQYGPPFYSVDAGEAVTYYVCNGNHLKTTFLPLSHVRPGQMQVTSDL